MEEMKRELDFLDDFFAQSARTNPDRVAIENGYILYTYQEADRLSNQLANMLRDQGVDKEEKVAILLPRRADIYIAMLAVLKAGGAYIPLDAEIPAERVNFIMRDSGAKLLISSSEQLERMGIQLDSIPLFNMDHMGDELVGYPVEPPVVPNRSIHDLCYIIYTSGTTGTPKGVMLEHRNVVNYLLAAQQIYPIDSSYRALQGFSVSFDASVEEIWLPLSVGATLVTGTFNIMRSGDQFANILNQLSISFLSCAPTLLSMVKEDIPGLRILIFGGEVCTNDLAHRWCKPGRLVYNTYGPTEATVIATYSILNAQEQVTIGRALPGYDVLIVNDRRELVAEGEEGELWIGGASIARGYLNQEELTRKKFIETDQYKGTSERYYRTGDIAKYKPDGTIVYVGRSDAQVKVRGFRVELSEIESLLLTCDGVQAAVVSLHLETQQLAAYVVVDQGKPMDRERIASLLRAKLPYYMVPATLDVIQAIPMTASQKVDRKHLPEPSVPLTASASRVLVEPTNTMEKELVRVIAKHIHREDISMEDHFFDDLGGHSLLAAIVTSELRENKLFENMSVADIYRLPQLSALASYLEQQQGAQHSEAKPRDVFTPSRLRYYTCSFVQGISMLFIALLFGTEWLGPFFVYSYYYQADAGLAYSLLMMLLFYFSLLPALSIFAIVFKWLVIGRVKAGRYKLWGAYYFRFWITDKVIQICPVIYFTGTPLMNFFLWLMGARIGRDAYINTSAISVFDLLSLGNNVSVCTDSHLKGYHIADGYLHIGRISIEDDCFIGTRCNLSHNTRMRANSSMEDLSLLPEGCTIPENEVWGGSPATKIEINQAQGRRKLWSVGNTLLFAFSVFLIPLVTMIAYFPGMMLITHVDYTTDGYRFLWLVLLVSISFVVLLTFLITVFKWLMLGNLKDGDYPVDSWFYYKKWFFDQLMKLSLQVIGTLYTTLYLQIWFKYLGVKMGRRAEISTVEFISPDLLEVGDECFLADSVSIGASHVRNGTIRIAKNHIGNRTFVGNSAVISPGTQLGNNVLVGVLSKMDKANLPARDGTSWFGSPAVFLPRRDINHEFSIESTYEPSPKLVRLRYCIEFFRVILPATFFILLASLITNVVSYLQVDKSLLELFLVFPGLYLGAGLLAVLVTAVVKWSIIGRYKPSNKPLWSTFVWRSELVTGVYENFLVLFFLNMLTGTPFIKYPLRLLGCKIGKRTCVNTTQITEFDLIRIGDDTVLNDNCTLQTHLFEDRVMKMSYVTIGHHCNVGGMAVVLYDSKMGDYAELRPLSVLMKNETLPEKTIFVGAPAQLEAIAEIHAVKDGFANAMRTRRHIG